MLIKISILFSLGSFIRVVYEKFLHILNQGKTRTMQYFANKRSKFMKTEYTILELLLILKKRIWLIALCAAISTAGIFSLSEFVVDEKYTADLSLYVEPNSRSSDNIASPFFLSSNLLELFLRDDSRHNIKCLIERFLACIGPTLAFWIIFRIGFQDDHITHIFFICHTNISKKSQTTF